MCHVVRYEDEFVVGRAESFTMDVKPQPFEEENQHLREAVSALRAAVRTERGQREGVERECNLLLAEFSRLQTRVQVRCRAGHIITACTVLAHMLSNNTFNLIITFVKLFICTLAWFHVAEFKLEHL